MDATTGRVLIEHEGDTVLPMASTTKIMTAILALERGNLADLVTAGPKVNLTGGSTIWLEEGEQQSLEDLLYALMLESANDAAVVIAEHLAGTEERFAEWMNEEARSLGADRTHFVNSHGLHHAEHYTTAHDLALIARHAMQNPAFRALIRVEEKEIPGPPGRPPRKLINHNRLLGFYEGANGVKNGFTEEALLTNVASAKRGDTELIAVILGAEWKLWTSSMALLDVGFERYETRRLATAGTPVEPFEVAGIGQVEAAFEADLWATLPRVVEVSQSQEIAPLPDLRLPIAPGDPVASVRLFRNGQPVAEGRLVAVKGIAPQAAVPVPPQIVTQSPTGPSVPPLLWVVAWLGASLVLTLNLNRLRAV